MVGKKRKTVILAQNSTPLQLVASLSNEKKYRIKRTNGYIPNAHKNDPWIPNINDDFYFYVYQCFLV